MNPVHGHLMLSHVPVIGVLAALLALAYATLARSRDVQRLGLLGLVLCALLAWPVFLSGDPAEEVVEQIQGVPEEPVDRHEDSGKVSIALVELAGLLALVAWMRSRGERAAPRWVAATTVAALVAAASLIWTANLGGHIRHPEIGGVAGAAVSTPAPERDAD